jgi:pyrroloquinoline quinone biosynthesis protein B
MRCLPALLAALLFASLTGCAISARTGEAPFVVVLGVSQDGGTPQAADFDHPGWRDASRRRLVSCLGLVDPRSGGRWMFDATPDFREQLTLLHDAAPGDGGSALDGVFLTHAHIGHYTGLMFLGHESMGARATPVYAMARMRAFLESNGPWSQLVRYENIELRPLSAGERINLAPDLGVTPLLVPHRQEFSEVVAFRIDGPDRSALFLPDIDSWRAWDEMGTRLEDILATVDVAYIDATFFADGEIPGRDMSGFPHPFITTTMDRLRGLPAHERAKVRFIHLNHTNPAHEPGSGARREIRRNGMRVAVRGERFALGQP